ncbi:hypothetical protein EJ05DRAFT_504704 [Pseudovirgaria hyperparasitica]|uniref:Zn(2)-C6 fungal-type domain-containing protein n=1 Tax=Pseudovirgaria hyperparasitica TaxID=470096 RepID=A0A6A6VSG4_9PEZI|nr:uncharacterized protein EJ05DRAFT_504704 [Pseudovirgaria hyperparasitica]KAF2753608.1 hypothetical protein EJ05DRAFT_504704 [Pseudovirgaria hyperparasitica]
MVGVPGRSKGCNTCRKRKKGCDLRRPACGQCLASGRVCEGYERPLSFVPYRDGNRGVLPDTGGLGQRSTRNQLKDPLLLVHNGLDRASWENLVLGRFWEIHLPGKELIMSPFAELSTSIGWYDLASCLAFGDSVLRLSLLALSFARLHLLDPDNNDTLHHSIKLYGDALKELNVALRYRNRRLSDDVLYACAVLALYEVFQGAAAATGREQIQSLGYSWMSHTKGVCILLQVRGPERHSDGLAHRQFRSMRLNGLISAIQARKKSFFNTEEWLSKPWSKNPKNLRDEVIDILAVVPDMLENVDATRAMLYTGEDSDLVFDELQCIVGRCCHIDIALQDWMDKLQAFCRKSNFSHAWPEALIDSPNDVPAGVYSLAHITILYWAICIVVYTNLRQVIADLGALRPSYAPMTLSPHTEPSQYATMIRKAAPYFFHPALGGIGPTNASFPMGIAMLYFGASENEEELQAILAYFSQLRMGGTIKRFLNSMRADSVNGRVMPTEESHSRGQLGQHNTAIRWWGFVISPLMPGTESEEGMRRNKIGVYGSCLFE